MRRGLLGSLLLSLLAAYPAFAQKPGSNGAFMYGNTTIFSAGDHLNIPFGFVGQGAFGVAKHTQIVIEGAFGFRRILGETLFLNTISGGPRFVGKDGPVQGFAQVLAGFDHATVAGFGGSDLLIQPGFGVDAGGGHAAFRVEGDWLVSYHTGSGETSSFRFCVGVVIRAKKK